MTGLATAMMDSVPMVAIIGNVARALMGKDAFQETDIVSIALPVTKYATVVMDPDRCRWLSPRRSRSRPRGGRDRYSSTFRRTRCSSRPLRPTRAVRAAPPRPAAPGARRRARGREFAELIANAERPLILSGHGVQIAGATDLLRQVAERTQIPVAHTLLGIGNLDETHPLSLGYAGMHGWMHVNKACRGRHDKLLRQRRRKPRSRASDVRC